MLGWRHPRHQHALVAQIQVAQLDTDGRLDIPKLYDEVWIDVGVNRDVLTKVPNNTFVIAFEPLLDKYARHIGGFQQAPNRRSDWVPLGHYSRQGIILPFALSPQEGEATFHVPGLDGCSSLLSAKSDAHAGCFSSKSSESNIRSFKSARPRRSALNR